MKKQDTTPDQVIPYVRKECYRCHYAMAGTHEILQRHCPRCCYDNDTIEVGERHVSEEERRSWVAAVDLGLMYFNWARGYCGLMSETQESDYSSLDDLMVDIMEHSFPYLYRLVQEGILTTEALSYVRACANEATLLLLDTCLEYEELQRLEGTWGDSDDDIKRYWLDRQKAVSYAISSLAVKRIELEDNRENGEDRC
jgi:hypothetical protein